MANQFATYAPSLQQMDHLEGLLPLEHFPGTFGLGFGRGEGLFSTDAAARHRALSFWHAAGQTFGIVREGWDGSFDVDQTQTRNTCSILKWIRFFFPLLFGRESANRGRHSRKGTLAGPGTTMQKQLGCILPALSDG